MTSITINARIKSAATEESSIAASEAKYAQIINDLELEMESFTTKRSEMQTDMVHVMSSLTEHKEFLEMEMASLQTFAHEFEAAL